MINIETIKFVKMLDRLAELTKGGIFELKKASKDDISSSKVFYDKRHKTVMAIIKLYWICAL